MSPWSSPSPGSNQPSVASMTPSSVMFWVTMRRMSDRFGKREQREEGVGGAGVPADDDPGLLAGEAPVADEEQRGRVPLDGGLGRAELTRLDAEAAVGDDRGVGAAVEHELDAQVPVGPVGGEQ